MKNKDILVYIGIIMFLSLVLCLLWVLIIINTNNDNNCKVMDINNSRSVSYKSVKKIAKDEDIKGDSLKSTNVDENAILVLNKVKSNILDISVEKKGGSSAGDDTSFYGINSAILVKDGAVASIKNANINTDAVGANGVFSYGGSATTKSSSGDGSTINISDSRITTNKDNSGGIMTTGGGVMNATNLNITTFGTSSAAIRSDRGGGKVTINKGTYVTKGKGSPAVYSTADITVTDSTLVSEASEGLIIEGKNKISIDNVNLTDTNNVLHGQSTTYKNIFIYQSMSGDADTGIAEFFAKKSTIITNKGDSIYVTNTKAKITLENNRFINNDLDGNFIRIQNDSWGSSGSNGGDVNLNLINQSIIGNIVVDSISKLSIDLKASSYYEGILNNSDSARNLILSLDKSSKIKLNGDSYVSQLNDADKNYSNINFNGYKLYVNGKSIK